MTVTRERVLNALKSVRDPDLKTDIVTLGFIKQLDVRGGSVSFTIELTTPACPVRDLMKEEARKAVAALEGVSSVEIRMSAQVRSSVTPPPPAGGPEIKNIIPIASGKGGVGKSTVSANLALALADTGASVGLMDGDVYGPSIPKLLGITEDPQVDEENRMLPVERYGLKVMSMGFFMKPDEATIWRGPMLHKTVQQFLGGVLWGPLDYLIVDLPPGTGDVQLSLCQSIPLTGAAIVSTPQDVALNVAQKAIFMFKKLNTPILGIIENMSYYVCPNCRQQDDIFGTGGASELSSLLGVPLLGQIPLTRIIRETSDAGKPIVLDQPGSDAAKAFVETAKQLAAQVSIRGMAEAGPKISF